MSGGEYGTDPINARCDWAEVSEEGVAYGYDLPVSLVGEIVVGPPLEGETDSDYSERVIAAADYAKVEEFLAAKYGADVVDNGDNGDLSLEFYVPFGKEGLTGTSIQSMGDRAENETKLLTARNDWEYSGAMQDGLAAHLGYESSSVSDDAGWAKTASDTTG